MKKSILTLILGLFIIPLILVSCQKEDSSDVTQDSIYTVYELFYNENTDKTIAVVRLRFGSPTGTLLQATGTAQCTFNGDVLPYSTVYNGHAKEYAGLITTGTFSYTNTEGVTVTNTPPTMTMLTHPSDLDTIAKSQVNTYTWQGDALAANERIDLFVGTWTWGQDAIFYTSNAGANNLVMGTNQVGALAVGGATLFVDRVHEVGITQGTSEGGVIRTRYRPMNIQVEVVP